MNQQNTPVTNTDKWQRLFQAANSREYVESWLDLQCSILGDATSAVVVLGSGESGPYNPVAFWPPGEKTPHLSQLAEKTLSEKKSYIVENADDGQVKSMLLSYPLVANNSLYGAVVIEVACADEKAAQARLRELQWGCAWLDNLVHRQDKFRNEGIGRDLSVMLGITRAVQEQDSLFGASLTLVNELCSKYKLTRVSIGFRSKGHTRIQAVSHNTEIKANNNLVRAIEAAMDEAVDQDEVVVTGGSPGEKQIRHAHEKLRQSEGVKEIATIPLKSRSEKLGALTLESGSQEGFDPKTLEICRQLAIFLGNFFKLKLTHEQHILQKIGNSISGVLARIIGPGHIATKVITGAIAVVILGMVFIKGDFKITARAYLEGSVQSAVVSPFDSFVASAPVRAGDIVDEGTLLVTLDDRDLRLESLRLETQKDQYESQLREALSKRDRAQTNILQASVDQVETQMAFIEEQIKRTKMYAPFRGVVVSGDLSQSLGAPMRKGEILFELAPLESYRIVLEVDDRDIARIRTGLSGEIVLSAFPDQVYGFEVNNITPVATASEGRNYFRVEAELDDSNDSLRPGMEGVAKILVDQRNLLWIWSRRLVEWFMLWSWSSLP